MMQMILQDIITIIIYILLIHPQLHLHWNLLRILNIITMIMLGQLKSKQ